MKALIWKEWREHRIFLLMAVGIILCINIGSIIYLNMPSQTAVNPLDKLDKINECNYGMWIILPSLFALILGAFPFAKEFSNNTQDFLLQKPIATAKIFWVKFFFGIFLLLFIIQIIHLVLYIPYSYVLLDLSASDIQQHYFTFFYFSFIFVYSAVFFSSLLVKRELPAMLLSPLVVALGILYVLPLYLILIITLSPERLSFLFFDDRIPFLMAACILFVGFILFGFLIWQKAISKGIRSMKVFINITGIIFLIYLVAYVVLNFSTGVELSKTIKQAKANGMKLTLEEIIPPQVPKEQNAAFIYQEAFDLVDKLEEKYKDEWDYMPYESKTKKLEELTREQKNIIAKLLLEDKDFIKLYALIEKAIDVPECRFDLKYEEGFMMPLSHLQKIRQLARLVAARTYMLTEEKRYEEAWESSLVGLKIGESLKDEPTLTSQFVRIALDGIAMESFQPAVSIFPEEILSNDYQELILEIGKKEREITKGLEAELAFTNILVFKELLKGNVGKLYGVWGQPESGTWKLFLIFYGYIGRPLLKQDYAFYVHSLTESVSLSHLPYYQSKGDISELDRKIEEVKQQSQQFKYTLSSMLIPALTRSHVSQARDNAQLDGLKIACALKIYKKKNGYYPDKLIDLVPDMLTELPLDEFTGSNFIYRKQGKGFIVYSLGTNGEDDNGISQKENTEIQKEKGFQSRNSDAYDIVWKCEE